MRDLVEGRNDPCSILPTYFSIRLADYLLMLLLIAGYLMVTHADDRLLMVLVTLCSGANCFALMTVQTAGGKPGIKHEPT